MKSELEKVQKGIKTDTIILKVICIFFGIIVLVVVFGILSEIFRYGCTLQEEMNQIA